MITLSKLFRVTKAAPREDSKPLTVSAAPNKGQRVVVVNYHVGDFLESWNGQTGIVVESRLENTYVQIDGYPEEVSAVGFPHENLLVLKGDLAVLPPFVTPGKPTITICAASGKRSLES